MSRLVPIEADRIDELLDLGDAQFNQRLGRATAREQSCRRRGRDRILRLRRQHRRDQDLKGIGLLFVGDLLDCRVVHTRDGRSKPSHDLANRPT